MTIIKKFGLICLCLAFAAPALAQPGGGPGMGPGSGKGPGGGMGPMMYNPQTVTTIKGVLQQEGAGTRRARMGAWIAKTGQGDVTLHLGPPWYLSEQKMVLNSGTAVEVTGSKVVQGGKTLIVAREITVAGKTVKLRDDQGVPLWRGRGPGQQQPQQPQQPQ